MIVAHLKPYSDNSGVLSLISFLQSVNFYIFKLTLQVLSQTSTSGVKFQKGAHGWNYRSCCFHHKVLLPRLENPLIVFSKDAWTTYSSSWPIGRGRWMEKTYSWSDRYRSVPADGTRSGRCGWSPCWKRVWWELTFVFSLSLFFLKVSIDFVVS